jgi:hypothetical protein
MAGVTIRERGYRVKNGDLGKWTEASRASSYAFQLGDFAFPRLRGRNPHACGGSDHGLLKKTAGNSYA